MQTVRTTAAKINVQMLFIENPGVKKAVIAKTTAAPINLPTICHKVELLLFVFDSVFDMVNLLT